MPSRCTRTLWTVRLLLPYHRDQVCAQRIVESVRDIACSSADECANRGRYPEWHWQFSKQYCLK